MATVIVNREITYTFHLSLSLSLSFTFLNDGFFFFFYVYSIRFFTFFFWNSILGRGLGLLPVISVVDEVDISRITVDIAAVALILPGG